MQLVEQQISPVKSIPVQCPCQMNAMEKRSLTMVLGLDSQLVNDKYLTFMLLLFSG